MLGVMEKNTGSSLFQVTQLSERIGSLAEHLKGNKKDEHSRYGLIKMLSQRRKHLKYLERKNPEEHKKMLQQIKK